MNYCEIFKITSGNSKSVYEETGNFLISFYHSAIPQN